MTPRVASRMAATGLYEPRDGAPVVKPPFALVPDPPSVDGTAVDVGGCRRPGRRGLHACLDRVQREHGAVFRGPGERAAEHVPVEVLLAHGVRRKAPTVGGAGLGGGCAGDPGGSRRRGGAALPPALVDRHIDRFIYVP